MQTLSEGDGVGWCQRADDEHVIRWGQVAAPGATAYYVDANREPVEMNRSYRIYDAARQLTTNRQSGYVKLMGWSVLHA